MIYNALLDAINTHQDNHNRLIEELRALGYPTNIAPENLLQVQHLETQAEDSLNRMRAATEEMDRFVDGL
ncbi:unnamed protein product [Tilletia controversa]|nr:unnamed protein product [Tilletia controversa]